MKKHILLFARDPGAANTIIPLYRCWRYDDRFDVMLLGKEFALTVYEREGCAGADICQVLPALNEEMIAAFLQKQAFDLVITGVGSTDVTERLLWKVAGSLGIPSLCLMDQWLNYEARFAFIQPGSDVGEAERVYPTYIGVIDGFMKREMEARGLPGERMVMTGQPYFETARKQLQDFTNVDKQVIRERLKLKGDEFVLVFASEPITESYQDPWYLGYTQYSIFEAIVRAVGGLNDVCSVALVIKLHPRNDKDAFVKYIQAMNIPKTIQVRIVDGSVSAGALIAVSDVVLGMSSMMLLEAALIRKPCISVQIGLKRDDPFILSRQGLTQTIVSDDGLVNALNDLTKGGGRGICTWQPAFDATERISRFIQTILYA